MTAIVIAEEREQAPPAQSGSQVTWAGYLFVGFWILVGIGLIVALVLSLTSDRLTRFGPQILSGFGTTLKLCALSLSIGALISIPVAAGRLSQNRLIGAIAFGYSYFFRGTPIIAQLFLVYYGAGQFVHVFRAIGLWWFFRDAFNCAVFAFAINTAAYQAEILYGAIRSVPRGTTRRRGRWRCRAM